MRAEKKPRRLRDWLLDVRKALDNIKADVGSLDEDGFSSDGKTIRAVTKSVEDIGEAAKQIMELSPNFEQEHPVTWRHLKSVYGMRNVLTHGYFRIDAAVVWTTATVDLPKLYPLLEEVLSEHLRDNSLESDAMIEKRGTDLCPPKG